MQKLAKKPDCNIVFFHIPKTAGSSFNQMLRANYGDGYFACSYPNGSHAAGMKRFAAMSTAEKERFQCLSGHLQFEFLENIPWPYKLVTFLRQPVERVLSLYYYYRFVDKHPDREFMRRPDFELREHVLAGDDEEFRNGMAKRLAGTLNVWPKAPDDYILEHSQKSLRQRFAFIGLQERYSESIQAIAKRFGLARMIYVKINSSPKIGKDVLDSKTRKVIEAANAIDMQLYEYGHHLYEQHFGHTKKTPKICDIT